MRIFTTLAVTLIVTFSAFSQTTYQWNGSVNSNFSTAGNWTPFRQVGLANDILIFESGTNLNVTNVNQVTVGQLVVRSNTYLTLSPSTGNTKVLRINGGDGEDLVIEQGSSLTISGNDPQLNIFLNPNATASIYGNLSFTGNIGHNLNAQNTLSIKFKNGSVFKQLCPGNIFTASGTENVTVFEEGSTFITDCQGALNPFGLQAPESKVKFEAGSTYIIANSNAEALKLSGRIYSNLTIKQNAQLNLNESLTSNCSINNLTVENDGILSVFNSNPQTVNNFNIKGSINISGTFGFANNTNEVNLCLNGIQTQSISGNGNISFPENLGFVFISNDILLERNLVIDCSVNHTQGNIITNNHTLYIAGRYLTLNGSKSTQGITLGTPRQTNNNEDNLINTNLPGEFSISQNYPNPFNPITKIDYVLPKNSKVTLKIFDINGREITTLVNSEREAGNYSIIFEAANLSSGIYFYHFIADNGESKFTKTLKMILSK
ncbi:MAG: T9SS type A sorting domain-containing protein [Chlorobi bacterium]|nr:T9SS type A sorting domain-containing protein [Chlorobiota bacterium]MCI0716901.1 T9SS type A sorting domain-containing protein [Chlorobiota bacterium]